MTPQDAPAIAVRMCSYGHVTLVVGPVTLHLTEDEFLAVAEVVAEAADTVAMRGTVSALTLRPH
jgi:hypothetical protein